VLEPCAGKLARTVLRGGGAGNGTSLPDYVFPPLSDEDPELACVVNLNGTRNLLDAVRSQAATPRLLFSSTLVLFGRTAHLEPPRRLSDPVQATDLYTEHKLQCEQWVQDSGLPWLIFRFSDVPVIGFRAPHPIMFEIPLDQRFEVPHTLDAGLAIANALEREDVWRRSWLIGGGEGCQLTYRQFLFGLLGVMGIGELPEQAFTTKPYVTNWLDTADSEAALCCQHHTFADILAEVAAKSRMQRRVIPLAGPLVQRYLLRMSPYMRAARTMARITCQGHEVGHAGVSSATGEMSTTGIARCACS
jgi:nucleoside-diphosphate-sugar epimerase